MTDTDRMDVEADCVQHMGSVNMYEVTVTRTTTIVAATAAEAIAMTLETLRKVR